MKLVFASDSFKGSLTSIKTADLLEQEARRCFPGCECVKVPVADGGEGTLEAVLQAAGGALTEVEVSDPLGRRIKAAYAVLKEGQVLIEMAAASGLPLLKREERNPLETSSYGTGELIRHALENGHRRIAIAIGGSATNDGGMGAMKALGIRFLDGDGRELEGRGKDLTRVSVIDTACLCPLVYGAAFTVMCDVKNPLTGKNGATYTFGPQKGGTRESLDLLEMGMRRYEELLEKTSEAPGAGQAGRTAAGRTAAEICAAEGAGAAGGLGAAFSIFLKAEMKPGIETVLDLIQFDKMINDADLVVTGEGRIDWQSSFGKVPSGVGERCKKLGIPAVAMVGGMGDGAEDIYEHGVLSIIPTVDGPMKVEEAMAHAEELYSGAAGRMFRLIKIGIGLA